MGRLGAPAARHGSASSSRGWHTCFLVMINDQQLRTKLFVSLGCHTHVTQDRPVAAQQA